MHRVHHSIVVSETNSNFDFNQPWWDRRGRRLSDQSARLTMAGDVARRGGTCG
jgi:sterol desaturase/sphingolipid hydroxylase (fatty acid hydroxylase superfamily)